MAIYEIVDVLALTQSDHDNIYIGIHRGQTFDFQNRNKCHCGEIWWDIKQEIATRAKISTRLAYDHTQCLILTTYI